MHVPLLLKAVMGVRQFSRDRGSIDEAEARQLKMRGKRDVA